jgi:transcriptional regulator with XRE-family HTH domain
MALLWNMQFPFTEMNNGNIMKCIMRRTSLSEKQAEQLAEMVRTRRQELQLSMRQVAATSGLQLATISQLESGNILAPQPDTLKALAGALNLLLSDLYAAAEWLPVNELPTLRPYMRAQYADMSDEDLARVEAFIDQLTTRQDHGPRDHEDE